MITRDEHLAFCKKRALEYWERGEYLEAVTSMMSDLSKHDELKNHPGLQIGSMMFMSKMYQDRDFVFRFIDGFR